MVTQLGKYDDFAFTVQSIFCYFIFFSQIMVHIVIITKYPPIHMASAISSGLYSTNFYNKMILEMPLKTFKIHPRGFTISFDNARTLSN